MTFPEVTTVGFTRTSNVHPVLYRAFVNDVTTLATFFALKGKDSDAPVVDA
jgi:hypothetical protein